MCSVTTIEQLEAEEKAELEQRKASLIVTTTCLVVLS